MNRECEVYICEFTLITNDSRHVGHDLPVPSLCVLGMSTSMCGHTECIPSVTGFVTPLWFLFQWRWPKVVFVLYRTVMAAYAVFAFSEMVVSSQRTKWQHHVMVYLTTWTYLMETLFFLLGALLALVYFCCPKFLIGEAGKTVDTVVVINIDRRQRTDCEWGGSKNHGYVSACEKGFKSDCSSIHSEQEYPGGFSIGDQNTDTLSQELDKANRGNWER